jgi:hypothetical protein
MADIKHRVNIVAGIAAIGAAIAFIGTVLSYMDFPEQTTILDLVIFGIVLLVALTSIKPSVDSRSAILNVIIGILAIAITSFIYMSIGNAVDAKSFMDVGIGVWLMFAGSILFTIFSISDLMFKRKA